MAVDHQWVEVQQERILVTRRVLEVPTEDMGLAEHLPFPFMSVVGQMEMRTALLLAIINPNVGGVLLVGPHVCTIRRSFWLTYAVDGKCDAVHIFNPDESLG